LCCTQISANSDTGSPDFQVIVIAGGAAGGRQVQKQLRYAQREQARLCADITDTRKKGKKKEKVAVDSVFYSRLLKILRV
jgi:hypothetical protein